MILRNKTRSLFCLLLFSLVVLPVSAASDPDYSWSRIQVKAEPTGAGKVYAQQASTTVDPLESAYKLDQGEFVFGATHDQKYFACPWNIYTSPVDNTKYKFSYWECTYSDGDYTGNESDYKQNNKATTAGTIISGEENRKTVVYVPLTKALSQTAPRTDPNVVNAIWIAHYELLEHHDVTVSASNANLGSVSVIEPDNQVGDQVTIAAKTLDHTIMFRGWKLNGEWVRDAQGRIIRDVPYTFTITDENKGEYVAQFESGYSFIRIKNRDTGHYITSDEYFSGNSSSGILGLRSALETFSLRNSLQETLDDQGTVVRWTSYPRPKHEHQTVHSLEIRGVSTEDYYDVENGNFLFTTHNDDNTYDIGNGGGSVSFHLVETNGGVQGSASVTANMHYLWDFEGIDKDLTTKENYYTPGNLVQDETTGLWYTTHRASWNTMFDTNEIKAYIVTGVDESGAMSLTEVTGGIIPKGVPVLLECQSNDVTRNVMIPTLTAATFTATSANILKSSELFFPNQPVPEAAPSGQTYYALGTTSDGRVGFVSQVTNTSTGINGNRGYYLGPQAAVLPIDYEEVTLAQLVSEGVEGKNYRVTDVTGVIEINSKLLVGKDDNGYSNPDVIKSKEVDVMGGEYDQSNWVLLHLPKDMTEIYGQKLLMVTGKLTDRENPEMVLDAMPVIQTQGTAAKVQPNTYIPASFKGTQTSPVYNDKTYFFVTPKPMEYAHVKWAIWNGNKFVAPVRGQSYGPESAQGNEAGLSGDFSVAWEYLDADHSPVTREKLESDYGYEMDAIIKVAAGGSKAPRRAAPTDGYVAYPITLMADSEIITGGD